MLTRTLEVELTDEEYAVVLSFPLEERRSKIVAAFATAPNPPALPVANSVEEADYRPLPYFDGDEVVTESGRRPRRPWDGKTAWDGVTTNPDDFPDFDDIAAEQMASMAQGFVDEENGVQGRDGFAVTRELRECIRQGKPLPTRERDKAQREQALRNGK